MKKSILITGRQGSGKTTKAKEIASQFQIDEVVFLPFQGAMNDKFLFSECTEKTKLIVVDDLSDLAQVQLFLNPIVVVNKKMKEPFSINPQFVLVCQSDIQPDQLVELGANFEVINCQFRAAANS